MTTRIYCTVAIVVLSWAIPTLAKDETADTANVPARVAAQTVYLHRDIEGHHRIAIIGELGGKGSLSLDPNKCKTNEFGDPEQCTRIAIKEVKITIRQLKMADPLHLGRKIYALEDTGLGNPLFLVVWPGSNSPLRLVYNNRGPEAPQAYTLEPLVYTKKSGDQREKP